MRLLFKFSLLPAERRTASRPRLAVRRSWHAGKCFAIDCVTGACALGAELERSVIQIMAFIQQPVWDAPWRFDAVHRAGGTGFVIKGKRIMTNAHVVSWAKQVIVRRYQDPRPYVAEVEFIGH